MNGSRTRSVLIDGGGFGNKGAEAMLLVVVRALKSANQSTTIIPRIRQHQFADARRHDLHPISNHASKNVFARFLNKARTARLYYSTDVLVDIGGYQFGDPWGLRTAQAAAAKTAYFRKFSKPVIYMPQAWGPFATPGMDVAIRKIIENCECAYVRDRSSLQAVQAIVGPHHPRVRSALDIAWNFTVPSLDLGRDLITGTGLADPAIRTTVCVTPNLRVYERAKGTDGKNEYLQLLARLITHVCNQFGHQVVLLGHALVDESQNPKDPTDDRTLCRLIMNSLPQNLPVRHIDQYVSAEQIKSVIGNCHLLISSRYHALIAAFSQAVPAAAIGWSHKYDELMQDVGLPDNILKIESGWDGLVRGAENFLNAHQVQRTQLERVLPGIRSNAVKPIQHMLEIVSR